MRWGCRTLISFLLLSSFLVLLQDEDELSFKKGEYIIVLPFPDPEDEDDGWLYGRIGDRQGVFPQNFTKPV